MPDISTIEGKYFNIWLNWVYLGQEFRYKMGDDAGEAKKIQG